MSVLIKRMTVTMSNNPTIATSRVKSRLSLKATAIVRPPSPYWERYTMTSTSEEPTRSPNGSMASAKPHCADPHIAASGSSAAIEQLYVQYQQGAKTMAMITNTTSSDCENSEKIVLLSSCARMPRMGASSMFMTIFTTRRDISIAKFHAPPTEVSSL